MEGEGYRRPRLCRLCECPVVDRGVRLHKPRMEKLSRWWKARFDTDLKLEKQNVSVCHFCVWDLRFADQHSEEKEPEDRIWWTNNESHCKYYKYYSDGLMRPFSVKITPLSNEDKVLEEISQMAPSGHMQPCPQSCPKEADAVTKRANLKTADNRQKLVQKVLSKKLQCMFCSAPYFVESTLNKHIKLRHKDVALKCKYSHNCGAWFKTEEEKQKHIQDKHSKKFKCIFCSAAYNWQRSLNQHINLHHKGVALKCKYIHSCAAWFKSEKDRQNHHREVHAVEAEKVMCPICNKMFSKKSIPFHIRIHLLNKKKNKYDFPATFKPLEDKEKHVREVQQAEEQDQILAGKENLRSNIKSKTSEIANKRQFPLRGLQEDHFSLKPKQDEPNLDTQLFKCTLCPEKFYGKEEIRNHTMIKHSKAEVCHLCEETCSQKSHHILRAFCKKCNKQFRCLGLMKRHTVKCKPVFHCPVCSKSFKMKCELNYHCRIKHTVSILKWKGLQYKSRNFKCDECLIYFSRKFVLARHMKFCNRFLKFSCEFCKKHFTAKSTLKRHIIRTHLGLVQFHPCPVCNMLFERASGLQAHVERIHSNQKMVQCQICAKRMKAYNLSLHMKLFH